VTHSKNKKSAAEYKRIVSQFLGSKRALHTYQGAAQVIYDSICRLAGWILRYRYNHSHSFNYTTIDPDNGKLSWEAKPCGLVTSRPIGITMQGNSQEVQA